MKIVYFTNHKNIHGNKIIEVEQWIDWQDFIQYAVVLKTRDCKQILKLTPTIQEAIKYANAYKTL